MLDIKEIRARCYEATKNLRAMLPEKVDYAELVCAESFAHGAHFVWTDPEPYMIDAAAELIDDLIAEVERLTKERDAAVVSLEKLANRLGERCSLCVHSTGPICDVEQGIRGYPCTHWQWRGVKEVTHEGLGTD